MGRRFSEQETQYVLRRKREGASFSRIGEELHRGHRAVADRYFEVTGETRTNRWSAAEIKRLVEALDMGLSIKEASAHVGTRSPNACSSRAISLGRTFRQKYRPENYDKMAGATAEYVSFCDSCATGSANLLRALRRYAANHPNWPSGAHILRSMP